MAETPRPWQQLAGGKDSLSTGDCAADPVPALLSQDDDDMFANSGLVERYWLPLSLAVLAGWGSISFVLVSAFGWFVILAIAGVVAAGSAAAVVMAKTGERGEADIAAALVAEALAKNPEIKFYESEIAVAKAGWTVAGRLRNPELDLEIATCVYAAIVSEMPAALAVVDADGLIVALNPEFDRLFPSRLETAHGAGVEMPGHSPNYPVNPGRRRSPPSGHTRTKDRPRAIRTIGAAP